MATKRKGLIAHLILWPLLVAFVGAYGFLCYRQNVTELAPDVKWVRIGQGMSKIIWKGKGVVAKGSLQVYFCDAGVGVGFAHEEKPEIYLDIMGNKVMTMEQAVMLGRRKRIDSCNVPFHCYMADTTIGSHGSHTDESLREFVKDRDLFLKRIELQKTGKSLE